ncbi:hypothetical protein ACLOJK_017002 [Asimina triloba]
MKSVVFSTVAEFFLNSDEAHQIVGHNHFLSARASYPAGTREILTVGQAGPAQMQRARGQLVISSQFRISRCEGAFIAPSHLKSALPLSAIPGLVPEILFPKMPLCHANAAANSIQSNLPCRFFSLNSRLHGLISSRTLSSFAVIHIPMFDCLSFSSMALLVFFLLAPSVVGWPPVGAFRKNLAPQPKMEPKGAASTSVSEAPKAAEESMYVKVNIDGYAVGRKINLKAHDSYDSLSRALQKMFNNFFSSSVIVPYIVLVGWPTTNPIGGGDANPLGIRKVEMMVDYFKNQEQSDEDEIVNSDHVLIYEDNEGDRMLVGDVPWEYVLYTQKDGSKRSAVNEFPICSAVLSLSDGPDKMIGHRCLSSSLFPNSLRPPKMICARAVLVLEHADSGSKKQPRTNVGDSEYGSVKGLGTSDLVTRNGLKLDPLDSTSPNSTKKIQAPDAVVPISSKRFLISTGARSATLPQSLSRPIISGYPKCQIFRVFTFVNFESAPHIFEKFFFSLDHLAAQTKIIMAIVPNSESRASFSLPSRIGSGNPQQAILGSMGKGNDALAMEIDGGTSDTGESNNPKFSINVLQLLKSAQMQHGLRHRDYTRYRRYCNARLRRLYKSLKFTHGRGKYSRRNITESTVTEVRFLHVVLYMAERAWSHAMEKRQLPDGPSACQRIYLIGRLRKAVKWASLFSQLCAAKGDSRTSLEAEAYASYMKGTLLFEQDRNWDTALMHFKNARAVYEELGKYGDVENQILCRERVEELEPSIRYCLHKVGESSLQTSELLDVGKMEGPALDLFKAKLEAVMAEARSQQAASMTEFHWLGHRFPITNAKTRVSILKAQELEKGLHDSAVDSLPSEKKLAIFDKIFAAYHEARSCIRNDLVTAGNNESVKDDLNGLDKAVSAVLGQRTIERNQLLVTIAKSKLTRNRNDKNEKVTKPEELVRLYDLLIQNTQDLSDLVSSGRETKTEVSAFAEEYMLKGLVFRAERCFYLAKSYSLAGKRTEAYALYSHARSLADNALQKIQNGKTPDKVLLQDLKVLLNNCRSNSCIEHAAAIMEEEKGREKLSKGVSALSLKGAEKKPAKYLLENLDVYESAVGDPNSKGIPRIEPFPPAFQSVACNPIVLDIAYSSIDFPSLEHRMKKDKKSIFSRLWR